MTGDHVGYIDYSSSILARTTYGPWSYVVLQQSEVSPPLKVIIFSAMVRAFGPESRAPAREVEQRTLSVALAVHVWQWQGITDHMSRLAGVGTCSASNLHERCDGMVVGIGSDGGSTGATNRNTRSQGGVGWWTDATRVGEAAKPGPPQASQGSGVYPTRYGSTGEDNRQKGKLETDVRASDISDTGIDVQARVFNGGKLVTASRKAM